ncbi:TonB-dependent receptor [Sphingobium boeckii]|uniref:Iron complex outermembrane receptor protein n=1 Tax=Sphingobium boeckii TaxID=1082345 RepID=A0A7W9EGM7_9SPHN|nr:TonB-dependent receptor [Sphingobium boeckii]MBB5686871.1 iron complex outermembrane receptor protein [Sphingobium boeckii]
MNIIKHRAKRSAIYNLCVAPIALATAFVSMPAMAQEDPEEIAVSGDIVVTAQRRSESIQDVPISITAFGAESIAKQNIQGVDDYFAVTPNVSFVANGSRDRRDLAIRGISNQLGAYDDVRPATYAFYINEFNVSAGTSNPDVVDMERIEILRGPQGVYFGRNAVGGAINIQTRKPTNEWEGAVNVGYSSFDTKRIELIGNAPIVDGLLAIRVAGQYQKSDGNIVNINPTGGGNDSEYKTGRIMARLTPGENFTWDVTYSRSEEETGMRAGVPTGFLTRTWRSVYYGGAAGNVASPDGVGFYPDNRTKVNFDRPQSVGTTVEYISSNMVYEFDTMSLTAVVGDLTSKVYNYGDVDGGSFDFFYEDFLLNRGSTSGEIRLQSTNKGAFEWSIGGMIGKDTGETDQATYYGTQNPLGQIPGRTITTLITDSNSKYHAIFGQGTWNATDKLSVSIGGRYSYEKIRRRLINSSNGVQTNDSDRTRSFKDFSPRFNVSYKASDDFLLYGTVSKGFKSGGVQVQEANLRNDYKPEELWSYEAGIKGELFDRRVRFDLTGFYMDWKDVQQTVRFQFLQNGVLVGVNGIDNAGSARSYGAEMSLDARISNRFKVGATAGWLEANYVKFPVALVDGITVNANGKRMVNAPRWTLSGNAEYTVPLSDEFEGFVRGEWNYRGETLSSNFALVYPNSPFVSPGFHNFNLRIGAESEKMKVMLFIENLFDNNYYTNAYEKAFYSGVQVEPSFQTVGINIGYKF